MCVVVCVCVCVTLSYILLFMLERRYFHYRQHYVQLAVVPNAWMPAVWMCDAMFRVVLVRFEN